MLFLVIQMRLKRIWQSYLSNLAFSALFNLNNFTWCTITTVSFHVTVWA
jgi:hypothetical protein